MCKTCGALNLQKRLQTASLDGRIALLTGGRTNIGYEIALKLLRAGARTIITTRFPVDAAMRFSREQDFEQWKERLEIVQADFRDLRQVMQMIELLKEILPHLDILINNAAQTVRRPFAYYRHLVDIEMEERKCLPGELKALVRLAGQEAFASYQTALDAADGKMAKRAPLAEKDYFPAGEIDAHGCQLDKRPTNSWVMKADEVSPVELLEVQTVNSTVPYMLCAYLKELMMRSPNSRRFIVNVSAMEGVFSNPFKSIYHPHTNMAKAALNMLTRTISKDYAHDGIFVNSVDTGWVNDESPLWLQQLHKRKNVIAPLDPIDGAARVMDPIFQGVSQTEPPVHGHFLKDYRIAEW